MEYCETAEHAASCSKERQALMLAVRAPCGIALRLWLTADHTMLHLIVHILTPFTTSSSGVRH